MRSTGAHGLFLESRAQIAQLQHAMMDVLTRSAAGGEAPSPQPGYYEQHPSPPYGYSHMPAAMLPQPQQPPLGVGSLSAVAPPGQPAGADASSWQVPNGTRAGQVFLVNGEYYVAMCRVRE